MFKTFAIVFLSLSNCEGKDKHFLVEPQNINVVGLFGAEELEEQLAFRTAIGEMNKNSSIFRQTLLVPKVEIVDISDAFNVSKTICRQLEDNITALFSGGSHQVVSIAKWMAETFHIPYLYFRPAGTSPYPISYSINLFPQMDRLTKGIAQVVHDMDWVSFTILYESEQDLIWVQECIAMHDTLKSKENYSPIVLKQLPEDGDYKPLLKEIHRNGETRLALICRLENVLPLLRYSAEMGLMGDYYSYLILSLDAYTLDYDEFFPTDTNFTTIRIIDASDRDIENMNNGNPYSSLKIKTNAALTFDGVHLFGETLHKFLQDKPLNPGPLNCGDNETVFEDGQALAQYLRTAETNGLSGDVKIDAETGDRTMFMIQIVQIKGRGYKKLGTWDPEHEIGYTRNDTEMAQDILELIQNKTFVVSSRIGEPYLMYADEGEDLKGNDRFKGYSMDLIDLISKDVKFSYQFEIAPGNKHGKRNALTGKWDGIIKELQERRADLGICDFTITHERRTAVEFTKPFMTLGISILYKKGEEEESHLFSFLLPFDLEVWLCVATALLGVSIVLFIVSRCTPFDWNPDCPSNADSEEVENPLSLVNCLWFSLGSVLQQGCDILPKAVSTRLVAAMWWFFTLIMVSTYTANLAAFLTSQQMEGEIKNVDMLANQNKIKYGCMADGSTCTFFKNSNDNLYQKIWATMESMKPSVFTQSNDEGVDRVLKDTQGYAFFMESSSIEYQVERHCDLVQVGGLLDSKSYGIAMPLNSPYRTLISASVLRMQENGKLRELKEKWWNVEDEEKRCKKNKKEDGEEENALALSNVGGVFLVLIIGMVFSFFLSLLEFLWNIRKVAVIEKSTLGKAFESEFQFVINCQETIKPVRKNKDSSDD